MKNYNLTFVAICLQFAFLVSLLSMPACEDLEEAGGESNRIICNESTHTEIDSVFWDFNLFSLTPTCAVDRSSAEGACLVVHRAKDMIGIEVVKDAKRFWEVKLYLSGEGAFSWRKSGEKHHVGEYATCSVYLLSKDYLARIDYLEMDSNRNTWRLKMVELVDKDLNLWKGYGFPTNARELGHLPDASEASSVSFCRYSFAGDEVLMQESCLRGLCSNQSFRLHFLIDRKAIPDGSVFWYWFVRNLIAVEIPW